jgi:hypothetical protein
MKVNWNEGLGTYVALEPGEKYQYEAKFGPMLVHGVLRKDGAELARLYGNLVNPDGSILRRGGQCSTMIPASRLPAEVQAAIEAAAPSEDQRMLEEMAEDEILAALDGF